MTWDQLQLADVVKIQIGPVTHPGLITGFAPDGEPLVTSNTLDFGVIQERLTQFAGGRPVTWEPHSGPLSRWEVVRRAEQMMGRGWSVTWNCEHFLAVAQGRHPRSPQLQKAVAACAIIALVCIAARGGRAA